MKTYRLVREQRLGGSLEEVPWAGPLAAMKITSPFRMNRMHPILRRILPHTGVDLAAGYGTPVRYGSPIPVRSKIALPASRLIRSIAYSAGSDIGIAGEAGFVAAGASVPFVAGGRVLPHDTQIPTRMAESSLTARAYRTPHDGGNLRPTPTVPYRGG